MEEELVWPKNFIELLDYQGDNPRIVFAKEYFISQWHIKDLEKGIAYYIGKEKNLKFDDIARKILEEFSSEGTSQTFKDIHEHFNFCINARRYLLLLSEGKVQNSKNGIIDIKYYKSKKEYENLKQTFSEIISSCEDIKEIITDDNIDELNIKPSHKEVIKNNKNKLEKYLDEIVTIFQVRLVYEILPPRTEIKYEFLPEMIKEKNELIEKLKGETSETYEAKNKEKLNEAEIQLMALEKLNDLLSQDNWISNAYKRMGIIADIRSLDFINDLESFVSEFLRPLDIVNLGDTELDVFNEGISGISAFYRQSIQLYGMIKTMYDPEILKSDNILEICQGILRKGRM